MAEDRRTDPDMGGAELDRDRKIGAHAHRQLGEAVALGDLRGQREMRRRRLIDRRDAHQPGDQKAILLAAAPDEIIGLGRGDAGLLRLLAGVELHEQLDQPVLLRQFLGECLTQAVAIDRMDGVEQRHRVLGLIGLQRPDQMQRGAGMVFAQRRPFRLGLLHPVLAEMTLPGGQHRGDGVGKERLGDRNQRDLAALAPRVGTGSGDLLLDGSKPTGRIIDHRAIAPEL